MEDTRYSNAFKFVMKKVSVVTVFVLFLFCCNYLVITRLDSGGQTAQTVTAELMWSIVLIVGAIIYNTVKWFWQCREQKC